MTTREFNTLAIEELRAALICIAEELGSKIEMRQHGFFWIQVSGADL